MNAISRRQLAGYAADQIIIGKNTKSLANELAAVLIQSKRLNQAELLASDISWELEARGMAVNAQVTAAHSLSETLRKQIAAHIKKAAKVDTVIMDEQVDKSVIGGVRI